MLKTFQSLDNMNLTLAAMLCISALGGYAEDVEAAKRDYNGYGSSARYLTFAPLTEELQDHGNIGQCFWLPHLTFNPVLQQQLPVQITPTLYRIDIDLLGWGVKEWCKLALEYPYTPTFVDPLIIRGDWFLNITSDAQRSKAYYNLLYSPEQSKYLGGRKVFIPKNRADFLKVYGIEQDTIKQNRTHVILPTGTSGVARKETTRMIALTPTDFGWFWETFDSEQASFLQDPTEHLADGKLQFEAQEFIASIRKLDVVKGEICYTQSYFLVNGQGVKQDAAPTRIVIDHEQFRGNPEIRTPGSCVGCHFALNGPSANLIEQWVSEGVLISERGKFGAFDLSPGKRKLTTFIEATYLVKQLKFVSRSNEDFNLFTELACGLKNSKDAASYWKTVVEFYDKAVTLEQAAREVYAKDAEELQFAIAYWSETYGPQFKDDAYKGRFSALASGFAVPRKTWEGDRATKQLGVYHFAKEALELWRKK